MCVMCGMWIVCVCLCPRAYVSVYRCVSVCVHICMLPCRFVNAQPLSVKIANVTPSTLHHHPLTPSPDHVGCYGSHAIVVKVVGGELLRAQSVGGDNEASSSGLNPLHLVTLNFLSSWQPYIYMLMTSLCAFHMKLKSLTILEGRPLRDKY